MNKRDNKSCSGFGTFFANHLLMNSTFFHSAFLHGVVTLCSWINLVIGDFLRVKLTILDGIAVVKSTIGATYTREI